MNQLFEQDAAPSIDGVHHHNGPVQRFTWLGRDVRMVEISDELYLSVADACAVLDIVNSGNVVSRIPDRHRIRVRVADVNRGRGNPVAWFADEAGAAMIAMRSDKPAAVKFQAAVAELYVRWRRGELAQRQPESLALPDFSNLSADVLAFIGKLGQAATAASQAAIESAERVRELEPSAEAWDELASTDGDFSVREAAAILSRSGLDVGQNRLFGHLRDMGLIDRRNRPYAAHYQHVRSRPTSYEHPRTGERVAGEPQVRITVQGIKYLHRRLGGAQPLAIDSGD